MNNLRNTEDFCNFFFSFQSFWNLAEFILGFLRPYRIGQRSLGWTTQTDWADWQTDVWKLQYDSNYSVAQYANCYDVTIISNDICKKVFYFLLIDHNLFCFFCSLFEILQSLYWAIYGLIDLEDAHLKEPHHFTELIGKLMFGSYSLIAIIVLLNMLIAMMSNSYQIISVRNTI